MNPVPMSMETDKRPGRFSPIITAVGPVLCIAVSYVGPGKWVASVEGGARLGYDTALFLFIISFISILCHYLSSCVAIATNKDLAQICREEYDKVTCFLLGIQAEISIILLDLTMVLGTAYALNAISGIDLFCCILLTLFDAAIFPFLSNFIGNPKIKFVPVFSASFALLSYFFGVLVTQPERSLSMGGMLDKLSGENAYSLMALLGANIMPHNFYLHSSIVQLDQGQTYVSKVALCHHHFFATLCIFSGIYLADCMLMNLSANVFYDTELVSLGLLDALSLLEQVFRSSAASFALIVFIFFLNHLIALTWSIGRQAITKDLFRLDTPCWFHRAIIRAVSIIPALYCVSNAGAEGVFQLLTFTQVLVAIILPSSVIPLFRIASCKSIMGECKVSQFVEVISFISFMGMLGLKIVFVMEMIFGSSEWVGSLTWNLGSIFPIPYFILLISAFASSAFSLFLVSSPLSSTTRGDSPVRRLVFKEATPDLSLDEDKAEVCKSLERQESALSEHQDIFTPDPILKLPENLLDFDSDLPSTTEENLVNIDLQDAGSLSNETKMMTELSLDSDVRNDKEYDPNKRESEDIRTEVVDGNLSSISEDSGSFKGSSDIIDDITSSTGSLVKFSGLGRAARRQLASILDEFWGQLFGYHGESIAKKLVLLRAESGISTKSDKLDPFQQSSYLNQQLSQGPSVISKPVKFHDSYEKNSGFGTADVEERRYFSLRAPSASVVYDHQPATVHGYDMSSYKGQVAEEISRGSVNSQKASVNPYTRQSSQKPLSVLRSLPPPGFSNIPVARNNALKSERYQNVYASEAMDHSSPSDVKKFYSMPNISGLRKPHTDYSTLQGSSMIHEESINRPTHENIASSWARTAYGFNDLFTPNVSTDPYSLLFRSSSVNSSPWSNPSFEHFGVGCNSPLKTHDTSTVDIEAELLRSFRSCIVKLMKLEGSDWLFSPNDGVDEDIISRVVSREKLLYQVETRSLDITKISSPLQLNDPDQSKSMPVPNCGDECVWNMNLIVSFGVWCIRRILALSLIETRPELWGKYTYVLNRLQGIIDPAFSKQRSPRTSCFCLQIPSGYQQMFSERSLLHSLPKLAQGKVEVTSAALLLNMIKDVEIAVSSRKGRSGTAAGDVAFPKGKENLASVLKRYKRRLSNKTTGAPEA